MGRLVSWHPSRPSIAVAAEHARTQESRVWIAHYESESAPLRWECDETGAKLVLRHRNQVNVTAVQWKPLAGATLALGCRDGIAIWTRSRACSFDVGADAGSEWHFRFLDHPSCMDITALAWSPDGELLASCAKSEPCVRVWTPARHQAHAGGASCTKLGIWAQTSGLIAMTGALHSIMEKAEFPPSFSSLLDDLRGYHGYGELLSWAPTGDYLFCATASASASSECELIVWETRTWNHDQWSCTGGVEAHCWSPDGRALLLARPDTRGSQLLSLLIGGTGPPQLDIIRSAADIDLPSYAPSAGGAAAPQLSVLNISWSRTSPGAGLLAIAVRDGDAAGTIMFSTRAHPSIVFEE
jgi:aladin|tara:strand:+ start:717 stop:1781 length:1065 start_codon:yes stop_codon:yes gene_type:complete